MQTDAVVASGRGCVAHADYVYMSVSVLLGFASGIVMVVIERTEE